MCRAMAERSLWDLFVLDYDPEIQRNIHMINAVTS